MVTCNQCDTPIEHDFNRGKLESDGAHHSIYRCRDALRARLTRAEAERDAARDGALEEAAVLVGGVIVAGHSSHLATQIRALRSTVAHGAGKPLADDPGPDAAFHAIDGAKLYVRRWPHAVEVQAQGPVVTLPLDTAHRLAKWLLALTLLALAGCCEEPARAAQPPPQSWAEPACSTTPLAQCPCLVGQRLTLCDCPDGGEVTP
jgi:hypothetical protein